jgi:hypothetical protein
MRTISLVVMGALASSALCTPALAQTARELDVPEPVDPPEEEALESTARAVAPDGYELTVPEPSDMLADQARLGMLFDTRADGEEGGRVGSGLLQLGLGATDVGLGLWLMLDEDFFGGVDMRVLLGSLSLGLGLTAMVMGVYELVTPGVMQHRNTRWHRALAGGLTERELGRFEGELRAEAESARIWRSVSVVSGFANVAAGLGVLLATGLSGLSDLDAMQGYLVGGGLALGGLIAAFSALFSESQPETDWRLYQAGDGPTEGGDDVDLSVAPIMDGTTLGAQLQGTF